MKLQFAMDKSDLEKNFRVVEEIKDLIDMVELGGLGLYTGLGGIKMVREKFPGLTLVWDQKCCSTFSNNQAIDHQPDFISIARMDDDTAKKTVDYAHSKGVKVVGDVQMLAMNGFEIMKYLKAGCDEISLFAVLSHDDRYPLPTKIAQIFREKYGFKFSVWGKLTRDNMIPVLECKPDILVIGTAIYDAPNPREETLKIKELMAKYS